MPITQARMETLLRAGESQRDALVNLITAIAGEMKAVRAGTATPIQALSGISLTLASINIGESDRVLELERLLHSLTSGRNKRVLESRHRRKGPGLRPEPSAPVRASPEVIDKNKLLAQALADALELEDGH